MLGEFLTRSLVGWESLGVEIDWRMALAFWKSDSMRGCSSEESAI
jgi:hypothetical protein